MATPAANTFDPSYLELSCADVVNSSVSSYLTKRLSDAPDGISLCTFLKVITTGGALSNILKSSTITTTDQAVLGKMFTCGQNISCILSDGASQYTDPDVQTCLAAYATWEKNQPGGDSSGMSPWEIFGIIMIIVIVLAIIIGLIIFFVGNPFTSSKSSNEGQELFSKPNRDIQSNKEERNRIKENLSNREKTKTIKEEGIKRQKLERHERGQELRSPVRSNFTYV